MLPVFLAVVLLAVPPSSWARRSSSDHQQFSTCIHRLICPPYLVSSLIYTPNNVSFGSVLNSTAKNLRVLRSSNPKPIAIFLPLYDKHVQSAVICARTHGIDIRVRSGGHDYEGLSYISSFRRPFVVVDLQKFRSVVVNVDERTAWVEAGATNGEVYRQVAMASDTLGVSAGLYTSLGFGGHVTGGGYGALMRMYGLACDNVVDAIMVTADAKILDGRAMGEDLMWAILGGGGGNFGIILAYKIRLLPVPANVTVFNVARTPKQGVTDLVVKWQKIAYKFDNRLFMRILILPMTPQNSTKRVLTVLFNAVFHGSPVELLRVMKRSFNELGLRQSDCFEVSWIQSVVLMGGFLPGTSPDYLFQRMPVFLNAFKSKSDFAKTVIPRSALLTLWDLVMSEGDPIIIMNPLGGRVNQIRPTATAFPNRNSTLLIQYVTQKPSGAYSFVEPDLWVNKVYNFMRPYMPRQRTSYVNYKDLELGLNGGGNADYEEIRRSYGPKYYGNNFLKLAKVKAKVDPDNFFNHEQSIPPYY